MMMVYYNNYNWIMTLLISLAVNQTYTNKTHIYNCKIAVCDKLETIFKPSKSEQMLLFSDICILRLMCVYGILY